MFTLEQIEAAHERFGTAETLRLYLRALNTIGVATATAYLSDGHTEYVGADDYTLNSAPFHENLIVADTCNREDFLEHLKLHNEKETSYLEMSKGLAESGIEKWSMNTTNMTLTFYDKFGNEILIETIS